MRNLNHKPSLGLIITAILLIIFTSTSVQAIKSETIRWSREKGGQETHTTSSDPENLLINGNMDELSFYPRPKNHYIAGMWYQWFWTAPHRIPEFIDGGSPYHQVCHPIPEDGNCANEGNHSQGYILWSGLNFTAGIYQSVPVTPCQMYEFQAYARNDLSTYRSKVGIDPHGTMMPPYVPPDGDDLPNNCPPDGTSACPNPGVSDPSALPSTITWSAESSPVALTWVSQTVTTEALSDTITVWTYTAASSESPSQSAYWDNASLKPAPFPENRLPSPTSWATTDFITQVTVLQEAGVITVSWETLEPAFGQVWYEHTQTHPTTTPAASLYTNYIPLVTRNYRPYPYHATPDTTPTLTHTATITGLASGDKLTIAILSRHHMTDTCTTEVYAPIYVTIP